MQRAIALSCLVSLVVQPALAQSQKQAVSLAVPGGMMTAPLPVSRRTPGPVRKELHTAVRSSYPSTHYQRGMYYRQLGDLNSALIEFLKATQENPRLVKAFYEQAVIFQQRGYFKLAESSLQQALAVEPEYQQARVLLATVRLMQGNVSGAFSELTRTLGLPENQSDTQATNKNEAAPENEDRPSPPPSLLQVLHSILPEPPAEVQLPPDQNNQVAGDPEKRTGFVGMSTAETQRAKSAKEVDDVLKGIPGLGSDPAPGSQSNAGSADLQSNAGADAAGQALSMQGGGNSTRAGGGARGSGFHFHIPSFTLSIPNLFAHAGSDDGGDSKSQLASKSDNSWLPIPLKSDRNEKAKRDTGEDVQPKVDKLGHKVEKLQAKAEKLRRKAENLGLKADLPESPQNDLPPYTEERKPSEQAEFPDLVEQTLKNDSDNAAPPKPKEQKKGLLSEIMSFFVQQPPEPPPEVSQVKQKPQPAAAPPRAAASAPQPAATVAHAPASVPPPVQEAVPDQIEPPEPIPMVIRQPIPAAEEEITPSPEQAPLLPVPRRQAPPVVSNPSPAYIQTVAHNTSAQAPVPKPTPSVNPLAMVFMPPPSQQPPVQQSNAPLPSPAGWRTVTIETPLPPPSKKAQTQSSPLPVALQALRIVSPESPRPEARAVNTYTAAPQPVQLTRDSSGNSIAPTPTAGQQRTRSAAAAPQPSRLADSPVEPLWVRAVRAPLEAVAAATQQFVQEQLPAQPQQPSRETNNAATVNSPEQIAASPQTSVPASPQMQQAQTSTATANKVAFTAPVMPSAQLRWLTPVQPQPTQQSGARPQAQPTQAAPEDPWTKRLKYLAEHGTGSLRPGEAFMFSEETGEAVLFRQGADPIRRNVAEPVDAEEVARARRPDILSPQDLQYNLSLLGKLLPKLPGQAQSQQDKQGQPADPLANFNVSDVMRSSNVFWNWLKQSVKL